MLKQISLKKNGLNRLKSNHLELRGDDIDFNIKSMHPGEWIYLVSQEGQWLGFINPLIDESLPQITILTTVTKLETTSNADQIAQSYIHARLEAAFNKRKLIKDYLQGCRLVYGHVDELPGLQVDLFLNACFIQINSAGLDRHREFIKSTLAKLTSVQCYFLDNPKYRAKESLPIFETEKLPDIQIEENGLKLSVRSEVLQKVGYYYDHRENRRALIDLMKRLNHPFKEGIDLFSYVGSWGIHALSAGIENLTFVDQGDFEIEIKNNLSLNQFKERGNYHRGDVFKFLDQCVIDQKKFDLILSDPPAFAKSVGQKKGAIEGYHKLHRKVFKVAAPWSLIGFSSCTHYVGHEEFQQTIIDESLKEKRKIHLIYQGLQGWDHPIKSTMDRSNYIKSFFYIVE